MRGAGAVLVLLHPELAALLPGFDLFFASTNHRIWH